MLSPINADERNESRAVKECQICRNQNLHPVLFLGYLPPVNSMPKIGSKPIQQPFFPAQLLHCNKCSLVQLGTIVDPKILFPPEYPYTSSTTKILRENFAELYAECSSLIALNNNDLIVDIGSNDGNLLSNFKDRHKVLGITPEEMGKIAIERGIPTIIDFFTPSVVAQVVKKHGQATIITATNVFAHIDEVNSVVSSILELLTPDGVFISESHYLLPLVETVQYDTIYHEHLRYYSLHSIKYLLEHHGLEIFHAKQIPTHGGSIRVYAARKGKRKVMPTVAQILEKERKTILKREHLETFKDRVVKSKLELYALLNAIKKNNQRIFAISAPSRASTLINYVGLDQDILDYVLEIKGSHKIGKYMPGTLIPVVEEALLFEVQPDYALLLSWHIADELIPKLKQKGFKGKFIIPLPSPRIAE